MSQVAEDMQDNPQYKIKQLFDDTKIGPAGDENVGSIVDRLPQMSEGYSKELDGQERRASM